MTERNGTININIDKLGLFNGYLSLDLSNQKLTDLSILKGQTKLTNLNLSNNQITLSDKESQEILKGMTELKTLNLANNSLTDISAINGLKNLTSLFLGGKNNNVDLTQIEDRISGLNTFTVNEASFQTIVNCTPSKITRICFNFGGYGGKIPDLSKLTSLTNINLPQCGGITDMQNLATATNLKSLSFAQCNIREKLYQIDFSKFANLTYLALNGNSLWSEDLEQLRALKNNKNLSLDLSSNYIIDASALLDLDESCRIYLSGNVNLSQESKDALKAKFGNKVTF